MIIKNILIAEDIRQEVGNKISVMGILGDSLNVGVSPKAPKEMPVHVSLAFFITIQNTDLSNDPKDFDALIFLSLGDSEVAKMNARIVSSEAKATITHLPVPKFTFQLLDSTQLTVKVQVRKNEKVISEEISVMKINLNRG